MFLLWALSTALLQPASPQEPPQAFPCVSNCLGEALAQEPTKGCPNGTFWVPYPRTAPSSTCRPCLPGYYCPGLPYGHYPDQPVNLNRPVACPAGTFLDEPGAANITACKNCTPGRYQDRVGKTRCFACPAGRYINEHGTSSLDDCLECYCGHYCVEATAIPELCPAGSYSPALGNQQVENCLPCPAGSICPAGTCNPHGCASCPAGRFSLGSTLVENPDNLDMCDLSSRSCQPCPRGTFCLNGSAIPTSCPPGTTSEAGSGSEENCTDCPVGYACSEPVNATLEVSSVGRTADGDPIVGSAQPVACEKDVAVIHFSYPNKTGCIERCPYELSRQSYCHVAGDGRVPDRGKNASYIASLVVQRSRNSIYSAESQAWALGNLTSFLGDLTDEERLGALTMPDHNGRTPLLLASMVGDVPVLELLWRSGADAGHSVSAQRDKDGYTALMQALRLGNNETASWLVTQAGADLSLGDALVLEGLGLNVSGVPIVTEIQRAEKQLGRGGLGWLHPSGENFLEPELGPLITTTFTTTSSTTTTSTTTISSTVTTTSTSTEPDNTTTTTWTTTDTIVEGAPGDYNTTSSPFNGSKLIETSTATTTLSIEVNLSTTVNTITITATTTVTDPSGTTSLTTDTATDLNTTGTTTTSSSATATATLTVTLSADPNFTSGDTAATTTTTTTTTATTITATLTSNNGTGAVNHSNNNNSGNDNNNNNATEDTGNVTDGTDASTATTTDTAFASTSTTTTSSTDDSTNSTTITTTSSTSATTTITTTTSSTDDSTNSSSADTMTLTTTTTTTTMTNTNMSSVAGNSSDNATSEMVASENVTSTAIPEGVVPNASEENTTNTT